MATVRVWITDGSLIPFSGVHTLSATHPAQFGLRAAYKGLIDSHVLVGSGSINGERVDDVLYAEAEWCLQFPEGIERYISGAETVELKTPIVLQGLIEGKWLNRLLGTDAWSPATLGNNLLAAGPGIRTTLGEIDAGITGRIEVSYQYEVQGATRTHVQSSTAADLIGKNVLNLARDVLKFCRRTGQAIDAIDLGAMGESAAIVNESGRIRAAMRFGLGALPNPLYFVVPRRRLVLMEKIVRGILADGLSAPAGNAISIKTYDPSGAVVGQGSLTWYR